MSTNVPEISKLVHAAHGIVINARRRDDLGSLTVRTVRKQVERDFALADGTLDESSTKTALRNAVNAALGEDLVLENAEKRKRSPEALAEVEDVKFKKAKKTHNKKDVKGTPDDESGASQKRKKKIAKSKETIVTDSEDGEVGATASTSRTKLEPAVKPFKKSGSKAKPFVAEEKTKHVDQSADSVKSDSEASALMDEPPRRKGTKGKAKENTNKTSRKSKKEKDPEDSLSSEEATIKKLKSFVSACGVRKAWSKEFADLPLPGQQIARLKQILADLGMTKRYSLEKAKAIKERRALSRELNDVVEFERKAGASRGERKPRANAKRVIAELDTNSELSESDDDDGQESPNAKKTAASKIILAYLANQSSDEE